MAHVYTLGAVKPWVKAAAQEVGDKFDISTIYGVGARANVSDHPRGLATDFMVYKDRAKGDAVYGYLKANWDRLGIKYLMWYQQEDDGSGLHPIPDRGGVTANHMDHVHASYTDHGGSSGTNTGQAAASPVSGSASGLAALTSSGTWLRVLMFLAGAIALALMVWRLITHAQP